MKTSIIFTLLLYFSCPFVSAQVFDGMFLGPETQLGDPNISYGNPEFSPDGKYMIWFEHDTLLPSGEAYGKMWHCGIDIDTKALIPADGKGYLAFNSSTYKRANIGIDSNGPYYVGVNLAGRFVKVEITGNTTGTKTILPTAPDVQRRGIFPSKNPNSSKQYVFYFRADDYPLPGDADSIDVRFIDLDFPTKEILVERQYEPAGGGWAAMDLAVPRWFNDLHEFTYGYFDANNRNQTRLVEITSDTNFTTTNITNDAVQHNDPSPFYYQNKRYIMPGINGGLEIRTYREPFIGNIFNQFQSSIPDTSLSFLDQPCRALSNEPFVINGNYYSVFLLSDCAQGGAFVNSRGEVWLHKIDGSSSPLLVRVSEPDTVNVINEPEVVSNGQKAWLVYSKFPIGQFSQGQDRMFMKLLRVLPTPTSKMEPTGGPQVAPNPTAGVSRLNWPGQVPEFSLQVTDMTGRTILEAENTSEIDLSTHPAGLYFLKVRAADGQEYAYRIVRN